MKRYFALFAVLFALATSGRAQTNCSKPVNSALYNYTQTPPTPPAVGATNFPNVAFCNGQNTTQVYTVQVFEDDYCQNTQNYSYYQQTTRTTFGDGVAYCTWNAITGSSNLMCNPRFDTQTTTPTSPTDYNRFYIRVYDAIAGQYCGVSTTLSRQDFWQCQGLACSSGSGGGGCCQCQSGGPKPASNQRGRPKLKLVQTDTCCPCSPILIDTTGKGFALTDVANGVFFDMAGNGTRIQMAWTAADSGDAFLVLPESDGLVHNGTDLFGSYSPQPPSANPNGFAALAVYDQPAYGGNGDGIIDARDAIYSKLRLWIDANHDGISQPNELFTLDSLGVNSISLNYTMSGRVDQYGNYFRYRAQVNPGDPTSVGKTAYDVFFRVLGMTANSCKLPPQAGK